MKLINIKKGVSLIEVILAVAIFSVIALPLLTIFVSSIKVEKKADDVVNANYISQDYLERLDSGTYYYALFNLPNGDAVGDSGEYSLTATITPYGNLSSKFSGNECSYIHLIMSGDGSALCVMPDGKWCSFKSVPASFSVSISYNSYSFIGGFTMLTGESKYNYCVLIVNAMKKPDATNSSITLGTNCKAVLYCTKVCSGDITISGGEHSVYEDIITGDTSLIYVTASLYRSAEENAIATSEGYINIKNWNESGGL